MMNMGGKGAWLSIILYIEGDGHTMKLSQRSKVGKIDENESSNLGLYRCEIQDGTTSTHLRDVADEETVLLEEIVMERTWRDPGE
jgi:hypothetical protein